MTEDFMRKYNFDPLTGIELWKPTEVYGYNTSTFAAPPVPSNRIAAPSQVDESLLRHRRQMYMPQIKAVHEEANMAIELALGRLNPAYGEQFMGNAKLYFGEVNMQAWDEATGFHSKLHKELRGKYSDYNGNWADLSNGITGQQICNWHRARVENNKCQGCPMKTMVVFPPRHPQHTGPSGNAAPLQRPAVPGVQNTSPHPGQKRSAPVDTAGMPNTSSQSHPPKRQRPDPQTAMANNLMQLAQNRNAVPWPNNGMPQQFAANSYAPPLAHNMYTGNSPQLHRAAMMGAASHSMDPAIVLGMASTPQHRNMYAGREATPMPGVGQQFPVSPSRMAQGGRSTTQSPGRPMSRPGVMPSNPMSPAPMQNMPGRSISQSPGRPMSRASHVLSTPASTNGRQTMASEMTAPSSPAPVSNTEVSIPIPPSQDPRLELFPRNSTTPSPPTNEVSTPVVQSAITEPTTPTGSGSTAPTPAVTTPSTPATAQPSPATSTTSLLMSPTTTDIGLATNQPFVVWLDKSKYDVLLDHTMTTKGRIIRRGENKQVQGIYEVRQVLDAYETRNGVRCDRDVTYRWWLKKRDDLVKKEEVYLAAKAAKEAAEGS